MAYVIHHTILPNRWWNPALGWTEHRPAYYTKDERYRKFPPVGGMWVEVPDARRLNAALHITDDDYDSSDKWGWAMSWLFAACDVIEFTRENIYVPIEFGYYPSSFDMPKEDVIKHDALGRLRDDELLHLAKVMYRYVAFCKHKGYDY